MSTENTNSVAFHLSANTSPEVRDKFLDHGRFPADIAQRGLDLVLTHKGSFQAGGSGLVARGDDLIPVPMTELDIPALYTRLVPPVNAVPGDIKRLNPNELKQFASSKERVMSVVPDDLKIESHYVDARNFDDARRIVEEMDHVERFVVKSDRGFGGMSVHAVDRAGLAEYVDTLIGTDSSQRLIVQQQISYGSLPESIQGYGECGEDEKVKRVRQDGTPSELRIFIAHFGGRTTYVPVLRVFDGETRNGIAPSGDVYVDVEVSDTLISQLSEQTSSIVSAAAKEAGAPNYYLAAVDWFYDDTGRWRVMEANLRSPTPPRTRDNPKAGRAVHEAIADTLAYMAER